MSEFKLIKENWDKYLQEEDEEQPVEEAEELEQLDEIQLPGLAWFVNSYRVSNEALKVLSQARWVQDEFPEAMPHIQKLAEANQLLVAAADEFAEAHPKIYKTTMGAIMASDIGGTILSKGKEYFLKALHSVMKKNDMLNIPAEEPQTQIAEQAENE